MIAIAEVWKLLGRWWLNSDLPTASVAGSARMEGGAAKLSSLHVVLDTRTSVVFRER